MVPFEKVLRGFSSILSFVSVKWHQCSSSKQLAYLIISLLSRNDGSVKNYTRKTG